MEESREVAAADMSRTVEKNFRASKTETESMANSVTAATCQTCPEIAQLPNTFGNSVSSTKKNGCPMSLTDHSLSNFNNFNTLNSAYSASKVPLPIKEIVSLTQLKQRIIDSSKGAISKYDPVKDSYCLGRLVNEYVGNRHQEFSNIRVKHSDEEFFTFCSCPMCLQYREIVLQLMDDQLKARGMWEIFVVAVSKSYQSMLKNATAIAKYDKLQECGDELSWLTCGYLYNAKTQHLNFIFDQSLTENMIFVLFSAILMVDNPHLLLQLLAFQIECAVKAYGEGFLEIVEPGNTKIPAEDMLNYILNGYDELTRISEHLSSFLFAFENDFMQKFGLTWTLLNQRMYQQHVYLNLTDTMLACIITLKEDELTDANATLIKKYIHFDDQMLVIEKRWSEVWIELNNFNLSEVEKERRKRMRAISRLFEVIPKDALELNAVDSEYIDITEWPTHSDRQLVWQNLMAYTLRTWPESYSAPLNDYVCDDRCKNCSSLLEYHLDSCKCVSCSIAGGPQPPKRNPNRTCVKCLALSLVEKEASLYESKILNVCATDDFISFLKNKDKRKSNSLSNVSETSSVSVLDENYVDPEDIGTYHVSWALFRHLNDRKRYSFQRIDERYFCSNCKRQACLLARKILNNEIAFALSLHLIRYYQPLNMTRDELRSMLPNIILYNRKMVSSTIGLDPQLDDVVVKIYWTFVISVFASYFVEFNEDCPLRLENFELANNDIKLNSERVTGNKDDTKFVKFLDKIKALASEKRDENETDCQPEAPTDQCPNRESIQKKMVEEYFKMYNEDNGVLSLPNESLNNLNDNAGASITESIFLPEKAAKPVNSSAREKSKKCCFDHSDLGDHCKENHNTKKRIKKECNHARMNETRERLRKKLSQLVNARKNLKATSVQDQNFRPNQFPMKPQLQRKTNDHLGALTSKASNKISEAAANVESCLKAEKSLNNNGDDDKDSLECLNTLCKRISHLHTKAASAPSQARLTSSSPLGGTTTKYDRNTARNKLSSKIKPNKEEINAISQIKINNTRNTTTPVSSVSRTSSKSTSTSGEDTEKTLLNKRCNEKSVELNKLSCVEQIKVKKWINEKLSFIEGSKEPKTTMNAKKAAKKAKQKQRKEELKRIAELQDFRAQFHDIYFKEFTAKIQLKQMKSSKKRDKKKIAEFEANVKKLNRAKAKVESSVLELIATIKLTNSDFKFSYLPTKEQQIEKIQELQRKASGGSGNQLPTSSIQNAVSDSNATKSLPQQANSTNNLSNDGASTANYSLPYAHANNFPYPSIMQTSPCVMPQLLSSSNVQMSYAANQPSDIATDPSKRIVTIRRVVNLPNINENQVTVTAKGPSPDKDKLLYTFVNGQLVQATNQNMNCIENEPIKISLPQPQHQHQMLAQFKTPVLPPKIPLTKTQLKKERKKAKRIAEEEAQKEAEIRRAFEQKVTEKQSADSGLMKSKARLQSSKSQNTQNNLLPNASNNTLRKVESVATFQSRRINIKKLSPSPPVSPVASVTSASVSEKISSKKPIPPALSTPHSRSLKSPSLSSLTSLYSGSANSCHHVDARDTSVFTRNLNCGMNSQNQQPLDKQEAKDFIKTKNRQKCVDNGQFDNNQFKLLHLEDFVSESETEYDPEEEKVDTCGESQNPAEVLSSKLEKKIQVDKKKQSNCDKERSNISLLRNSTSTEATNKINQPKKIISKGPFATQTTTPDKHFNKNKKQQSRVPYTGSSEKLSHLCDSKTLDQAVHGKKKQVAPSANISQKDTTKKSNKSGSKCIETGSISNNNTNTNKSQTKTASIKSDVPMVSQPLKRSQKNANRNKGKSIRRQNQLNENEMCIKSESSSAFYQQQHITRPTDCNTFHEMMQDSRTCDSFQQQMQRQYDGGYEDRHYRPQQPNTPSNVSIMDQLSRGVQVENLSLPPGITLTKVDPTKSEQLRAKCESIKKLSKPLQQHASGVGGTQNLSGATIIASGYYPSHDCGGSSSDRGGVIMVEAMPKTQKLSHGDSCQSMPFIDSFTEKNLNKPSKNKKRKNKNKSSESKNPCVEAGTNCKLGSKMVTLRNPMFHGVGSTIIQQQVPVVHKNLAVAAMMPNNGGTMISQHSRSTLPVVPLPMDQPAAIIKNENGMFTIRNPALQQAVANGLSMGGYRQFNANYYAPQEMTPPPNQTRHSVHTPATLVCSTAGNCSSNSFSYFSNSSCADRSISTSARPFTETVNSSRGNNTKSRDANNVLIGVPNFLSDLGISSDNGGDLEASHKQQKSNASAPKCLSAIGSEVKNAQQQKKSKENQWKNFNQDISTTANIVQENRTCGGYFGVINSSPVEEKYQNANYYNGFDVFPSGSSSSQISTGGRSNNAGSLFGVNDCNVHNCDDSPPPTITGFNHYLDGIPNTGVIRYDDAAFLKTLMPGQNLNNEVSIHNVNDSNFTRNATSPVAHRVEITPVFENRSTPSTHMYDSLQQQLNSQNISLKAYRDRGYETEHIFTPNNLLNLNDLDSGDMESFKQFNYDFEPPNEKQKAVANMNKLLHKKSSKDTKSYSDETSSMNNFVQNMSSLNISDEQSSELNGQINKGDSTPSNGWW